MMTVWSTKDDLRVQTFQYLTYYQFSLPQYTHTNYQISCRYNMTQRTVYQDFNKKISLCMDDLSKLLDNIYQFPNRQRELYYQRIQSLKQSLTVLKSSLKDNNSTSHQRKYQQIFLKINQLKAQILSYNATHCKRRPSLPLGNVCMNGMRQQQKYESIMETIVKKDEELKEYKQKAEGLQQNVRLMQQKEESMKQQIVQIRKQVVELSNFNADICRQNEQLRQQLKDLQRKSIQFQTRYSTHRQVIENSKIQAQRLRISLQDTLRMLKLKQAESESATIKLAALEEKYEYDRRQYESKEQNMRIRQKSYEHQLYELKNQLDFRKNNDTRVKQLKVQLLRCKQDVNILEAELDIHVKRQKEKNGQIDKLKQQILLKDQQIMKMQQQWKNINIQVKQKTVTVKEISEIKERIERENQNLHCRVAELEQVKMKYTKLIKELQKSLLIKQEIIKQGEQKNKQNNKILDTLSEQGRKTKYKMQEMQLQMGKKQTINSELNKIIQKINVQKKQLQKQWEKCRNLQREQAQKVVRLEREISQLKKKYMRAKIECIHNLRQLIV